MRVIRLITGILPGVRTYGLQAVLTGVALVLAAWMIVQPPDHLRHARFAGALPAAERGRLPAYVAEPATSTPARPDTAATLPGPVRAAGTVAHDSAYAAPSIPFGMMRLASIEAGPVGPILAPLPDEPASEELEVDPDNPNIIGGIDYTDHVARGAVPLVRIAGRTHERLSRGFRIRDFASRDGAPYARISDRLVAGLERVRGQLGSLVVISGYRHRAYNDQVEGSAQASQHVAGQAADVWSGAKTPLQVAEVVLATMGCRVGLGLGANTLHVDLRGYLSSWTYPGAAVAEADFDAWVQQQCGIRPADEPAPEAPAPADSAGHAERHPDTLATPSSPLPPSPIQAAPAEMLQAAPTPTAPVTRRPGAQLQLPGDTLDAL